MCVEARSSPYVANGAQYSSSFSCLIGIVDDCDDVGSKGFRQEKKVEKLIFFRQDSWLRVSLLMEPASIFTINGCRLGKQAVMTERFCAI